MALIFAIALTSITLPWLNQLSGQQLSINILLKPQVLIPVILVPFLVGIISGIYPAMFMSSFRPVMVLKGLFRAGGANISFRQVLVTMQFAISIILIISTAVVFRQLSYMQKKSLGFNKEHVITLPYNSGLNDQYDAFRNELLSNANVKDAGRSSRIPTGRLLDAQGSQINRGDSLAPTNADIKYVSADHDFIKTYGINIVAGRNFSRDFSTDTGSFLLNEAAVRVLAMKNNDEVLGKDFRYGNRLGKVIGVFQDFHFESMHQKIVPLVLLVPRRPTGYGNLSIKISGNNIPAALTHVESVWHKFLPEAPYQYTFLDENFERLYQSEQRQGTIFTVFACIAIFIACLGLFGLSAFAITQRLKEIGIRKVLGADISTIVTLLSKDFLKLVLVAAVIAFPVAWYAMSTWLEDFAYRIDIPWWLFLVAGVLAALVALGTISFQAIKAALANPVKALRSE
jgi:putative ABC transport system permease protein